MSIFDRTTIGDLSANGDLTLLGERGGATGNRQFIYLRRTDVSPPMRVAEEGDPLSLSPDGRWALVRAARLAFEVPRWQGLRAVPIGTGNVRAIATPGLEVNGAAWVRDGKRILVWGPEADRGGRLFLLEGDGRSRRALTPEGIYTCAVGQQRIACVGPTDRVTLYPLEGGEPRAGPRLEPGVSPLRLSDDETSLLVSPPRATRTAPLRVERVDLATGRRTLVHEIRPSDLAGVWVLYSPLVTPDGRGYAYSYFQFLHSLYLADGVR